jgi:hypothetical protein
MTSTTTTESTRGAVQGTVRLGAMVCPTAAESFELAARPGKLAVYSHYARRWCTDAEAATFAAAV